MKKNIGEGCLLNNDSVQIEESFTENVGRDDETNETSPEAVVVTNVGLADLPLTVEDI